MILKWLNVWLLCSCSLASRNPNQVSNLHQLMTCFPFSPGRGVRGLSLCPEFTRCGATKLLVFRVKGVGWIGWNWLRIVQILTQISNFYCIPQETDTIPSLWTLGPCINVLYSTCVGEDAAALERKQRAAQAIPVGCHQGWQQWGGKQKSTKWEVQQEWLDLDWKVSATVFYRSIHEGSAGFIQHPLLSRIRMWWGIENRHHEFLYGSSWSTSSQARSKQRRWKKWLQLAGTSAVWSCR